MVRYKTNGDSYNLPKATIYTVNKNTASCANVRSLQSKLKRGITAKY